MSLNNSYSIKKLTYRNYLVENSEGREYYVSVLLRNGEVVFKCTCPFHVYTKLDCKHILAVKEYMVREGK